MMRELKVIILFLLFIGMTSYGFGVVFAANNQLPLEKQVVVSREDMLEVARELHPPGCLDSRTADYCQLSTAFDLRAEIWEMLQQGKNKDQIIDELVQKYGERILAAPTAKGFNLLAWILPGAGIVGGGLTLGLFIRRWVRRTTSKTSVSTEKEIISEEQQKRVQEELKQWL